MSCVFFGSTNGLDWACLKHLGIPGRDVTHSSRFLSWYLPRSLYPFTATLPHLCLPLQVIVSLSSLVLPEKLMNSARLADTTCHRPSSFVPRPLMMGTSAGFISIMPTSATSECPTPQCHRGPFPLRLFGVLLVSCGDFVFPDMKHPLGRPTLGEVEGA